ncbi:methyltransferase domain-containing protein [Yoonia sp. SS1-5]|uniref:Class I SAM-dependent methyltransferase n=1 Tax=Yoonia rhodophyticola TaxID=3137370 RepID=A0AAN0MBX9_9RHOB
MNRTAAFWDKIAPKYAKSPVTDQASYDYTLGRTRSYLQATDRVLELGCGTGSTALLLAPAVTHILATDISGAMIEIARDKAREANIANITFARTDDATPEPPYDVIMAFNLFHLLDDMQQTFAQTHAQLKPGGYFISKTPCLRQLNRNPKSWLILVMVKLVIPLMRLFGKAPAVRVFPIRQLEDAITRAGFEIIESSNHPKGPPPARYIVARKR